jgi:hypothetical protein
VSTDQKRNCTENVVAAVDAVRTRKTESRNERICNSLIAQELQEHFPEKYRYDVGEKPYGGTL